MEHERRERCRRDTYIAERPSFRHLPPVPFLHPNGIPFPSFTGAYAPLTWGSNTVWLLAVEPTIAASGFVPEHGDWTIRIDGVGANAKVHAYVARSDPNMDVRTGARLSYFVDPGGSEPGRPRPAASTPMASSTWPDRRSIAMAPSTGLPPPTFLRARCRRIHHFEQAQVTLFVGRPCARRHPRTVRTTCCPATSPTLSAAYAPEATEAAACFAWSEPAPRHRSWRGS